MSDQKVHFKGFHRKAKALKPVIMGLDPSLGILGEHPRQPPILFLIFHKKQLVIQRCGQISFGIHLPAHGLGFQPQTIIAAALPEHLPVPKEGKVFNTIRLAAIIQLL